MSARPTTTTHKKTGNKKNIYFAKTGNANKQEYDLVWWIAQLWLSTLRRVENLLQKCERDVAN